MPNDTAAPKTLEYAGLSGIADEENAEFIQGQEKVEEAQQAEQAAKAEDNLAGWLEAVNHAASMVTAMIPEATPVWNKDRLEALAVALARCDDAYGWGGVGGLFTHPLVGLGFASFPLIVGTAKVLKVKAKGGDDAPAPAGGDDMGAAAAGTVKPEAPSYAWKAAARARSTGQATEVRFA